MRKYVGHSSGHTFGHSKKTLQVVDIVKEISKYAGGHSRPLFYLNRKIKKGLQKLPKTVTTVTRKILLMILSIYG